MASRVLITGASGLLGRPLMAEFSSQSSWEVLGLAFTRTGNNLKKVDLTNPEEVKTVIQEFKPTAIIHSAAERRPDIVEKNEEATTALIVSATESLCKEAAAVGAFVVYLSTDYVFDGSKPPYQVNDTPNPLNKYGRSKFEGEKVVMAASNDNIVLRVPILYGNVESLGESAVTTLFSNVMNQDKPMKVDDLQRRFPTLTSDVAYVIRQLTDKRLKDSSLTGYFHWSGDTCYTKYTMAMTMAKVFNLPTNHIIADRDPPPPNAVPRPKDVQLDTKRITDLGINKQTPFIDVIKDCLAPFYKPL